MPINYLDLFHGIGGFALGAYWAGLKFKNHLCSDIEPYCQKLYKLRFPDSIQLGNITKIDTQELINKYGTEWIITGGFPCQDISIAGKGAGITGSRSGLWFEYWRIIRDLRPRFAIMENVGAITFRGLTVVLGSLAEIGYNAEWQDIRASDVGAPHRRERLWIVAYSESARERTSRSRINSNGQTENKKWKQSQLEFSGQSEDVAYPGLQSEGNQSNGFNYKWQQRQEKKFRADKRDGFTDGCQEFSNSASEGLGRKQGLSTECNRWSIEPDVGRLAHGVQNRMDRLKGLGNSIVPQIAELLFRQIKPLINQ